jgi:hypothetical protein
VLPISLPLTEIHHGMCNVCVELQRTSSVMEAGLTGGGDGNPALFYGTMSVVLTSGKPDLTVVAVICWSLMLGIVKLCCNYT